MLVAPGELESARSIANFGHDLPRHIAPFCGNWKLSDIQAAVIQQRHSTSPLWVPRYRLQYARLKQIAERQGIRVLAAAGEILRGKELATPAYIALLLEHAVSQKSLDRAELPFVTRKYYRPLAPTKVASDLYSKIVCLPVHQDMAALDSERIAAGMDSIHQLLESEP